ncbi:MAG: DUF1622 domain-containing protein [Bacteroidota bacterium]
MMQIEELVKVMTATLSSLIEGIAAVIVALAVVNALIRYVANSVKSAQEKIEVRLELGKSLGVTLEFLLAADILRTAVAPTWEDIGKLMAIAALRTALNYFLEKELRHRQPHNIT